MKCTPLLFITMFLGACEHWMTPDEIERSNADIAQCQESIKQWITSHAVHPESYQPIAFGEFSTGRNLNGDEPVPVSETYTLQHTHRMLTNQGDSAIFSGYFLLDYEFRVGIIQLNGMNASGVGTYPEWQAWTDLFGRPMTAVDSGEWRSRSDKKFLREMEQARENMNTGDAYAVGASEDSGKAIVDTVIKALKR